MIGGVRTEGGRGMEDNKGALRGFWCFGVERLSTCQRDLRWHALPGQSAGEQRADSPSGREGNAMSAGFWGRGVASSTGGRVARGGGGGGACV